MPDPEDPVKFDPDQPIVDDAPDTTADDAEPRTTLQECRRRALEAEALAERQAADLARIRADLDAARREREIDAVLLDAGVIDAETVRALVGARLAGATDHDLPALVDDLRRAKPFLFARPAPTTTRSAMTVAPSAQAQGDDLDAALELAASGDRAALLRYLRLRRTA